MLNYLQPKNLETEAQGNMQDLETRKRIAELMSGIATQQLQAPTSGGVAGRLPGWAPLVQALAGGLAGMQQKSIAEGQQNILQQQAEGDQLSLDMLMKARQIQPPTEIAGPPQPGQTMPVMPGSGGEFSPEYKSALLSMIAKGSPRLQPFAKAELEHVNKNMLGPVDLAGRATLGSIQANPNDPSQWKAKQDVHAAEGNIYNVDETGGVTRLGGSSYADPLLINGDLYQNEQGTGKLIKLDNAPKVTVGGSQIVNAGQKEGMGAYWKNAANTVDALGQQAQSAQNNLNSLAELKNLHEKGVFSNAPSGIQSFAANLGQAFGIPVDEAKLANTETYNAGITDLWQGLVSKYGGNRGVTKEEAEEIKKMLPLASSSPKAREQIFSVLENVARRQINQYHSANRRFAKAVKMDDPEMFAEEFGNIYNPGPKQTQPALPKGAGSVRKWNPATGRIE